MRAALVIACLAGAAFAAEAEIYRWRDTQGRVHYGNAPPRDAVEVTLLAGGPEGARPRPADRRLAPTLAANAPPGFPGKVDEATIASLARALARPEEARAARVTPLLPQLSSLQLP